MSGALNHVMAVRRQRILVAERGTDITDQLVSMAASAAGAEIFIPDGTYLLRPAAYTGSIRLRGAGKQTVLRWKTGKADEGLMRFADADCVVEFSDLSFDGQNSLQVDDTSYYGAVHVTGARASVRLTGVKFENGRIHDVRVEGPKSGELSRLYISGCEFVDGLVGTSTRSPSFVIATDGVEVTAIGNHLSVSAPGSYGRAGILLQRTSGTATISGRYIAQGNSFTGVGRGTLNTLGCLDVYSGGSEIVITGNTGRNILGRFIDVKSDSGNIEIGGNVLNGMDSNNPAIVLFGQVSTVSGSNVVNRNLNIHHNIIDNLPHATGTGIIVDGDPVITGAVFRNVIVAHNIISTVANRGIHVKNIEACRVEDNLISDTPRGVFMELVSGKLAIKRNTILRSNNSAIGGAVASTAHVQVEGNEIHNTTGTDIFLSSSCASLTVRDNSTYGGARTFLSTAGTTGRCAILNNSSDGDTAAWTRTGTYGLTQYKGNVTSSNVAFSTREVTIASGAITALADWHWVDTEADAASDDLDTINGGYEGRVLRIFAADSARTVVVKDGTGNIRLPADRSLTANTDTITLLFRSGSWVEVGFADNDA